MLDQRLFRDGDLLCGKRAVRSVPEKAGRRKLLWRTDVCNGAAVATIGCWRFLFSVFTVLAAAVAVGSGVQAHSLTAVILAGSGVCTLDRHRSGAFGGQHPDRRSEKTAKVCTAWFR